ncbi:MAG: DUF167 domain-containing protein [Gammaproteobacteria bacterium]|nr:DUF167 domain-containing protein [Gammaproteobacteria bacterium]
MATAVREHAGGAILEIHVQPNAARTEWAGLHGNALKYRIGAAPVDDRANAILRGFLAKQFGISVSRVTIVRGRSARRKQVQLRNVSAQRALELLQSG